ALSRGKYLGFELKQGDTFLFSSKTIPGNERGVLKIVNAFSEIGVDVVDDNNGKYHVSGHANRPDLEHAHRTFLPDMLIPMHGEHRHLREHARVGKAAGYAAEIVVNGMMVDLSGNRPAVAEYIETGRTYLDGTVLIGALDGVIRDRIRMALNGHVMVTVLMDEDDAAMGDAWVECMGLPERGKSGALLAETLEADLNAFLAAAGAKILRDDDKMDEALRRVVRQVTVEEIGKKAEVTVVVSRLTEA
nr:ribonuclease J [Paracoccaceae bacterium]